MKTTLRRCASASMLVLLTLAQTPAWAGSPSQAPAQEWRQKHGQYFLGYTGKKWDQDYGITLGHCNRDAVGAVLGNVVDEVTEARVGKGVGQYIAMLVGSPVGAGIGAIDAACIAHALELARNDRRITWRGDAGGRYQLRPRSDFSQDGLPCRRFELVMDGKKQLQAACQPSLGIWEMR